MSNAADQAISDMLASAFKHHAAGQLSEAECIYRRILTLDPNHATCLQSLGFIAHQNGAIDVAADLIRKATILKPDFAEGHYNLGIVRMDQHIPGEAVICFERALALRPAFPEAHNNLGLALITQGDRAEAIAHYRQALVLKPDYAEAHNNLGAALIETDRLDEAIEHYEQALLLRPNYAEAHNNFGNALKQKNNLLGAIAHYERAIELKHDYPEAHNNLGVALLEVGKLTEGITQFEQALTLRPDYPEAHNSLGTALLQELRLKEATVHFSRALSLRPDFARARFALCMAQLPILYAEEKEITERRTAYEEHLRALCNCVELLGNLDELTKAVGSSQPFYLAYQGYNDRELQSIYGALVCRIMANRYPPVSLPPPPSPGEPVRVGIVSGYFSMHSNWKIRIKGWLSQLDRRKFRIFGYHTGTMRDDETNLAAALCQRFVQGPLSLDGWRQTILADAPHVLIYPEIGMHPVSAQLAAQRLAPTQCGSWGHPDTSGFPTIDYFLSSDLMEPPDGQNCYSEELVRLPNLSVYYEAIDTRQVSLSRQSLGLRTSDTVFWCAQSLFKYLPQFDQVFPRIAQDLNTCQFVFIEDSKAPLITKLFRKRLDQAFAAHGLNATDHYVFLPHLDQDKFIAAAGQCDIFLDSIGWSGANTTLECLANNLPIVTMAGQLMRGRHSMAILEMMGVTDTITTTVDEYVAVAIRLARDIPWRTAIKTRISENKHKVYRDRTAITALEQFLISVSCPS